ncbi:microtubule-associated protein 10 [Anableps anableps]
MMLGDNPETLFSLELLVDHIRLEKDCKVPDRIALGVRLLDFPTLLIYQHRSKSVGSNQPAHKQPDRQREFTFNRGKSCFFKMNLDSLHVHLSTTPLYAMVLDVSEESSPRLVGSSLISLAEAMDRIKLHSSPSAHTGKGMVAVCSLSGEKIGALSLSYKLVCLGASLLPHITEGRGYKHTRTPGGQDQEHSKEKMKSGSMCSPAGNKSECSICSSDAGDSQILRDEYEKDECAVGQTNNTFEEDLTVFCPPRLYYSNTTQAKSGNTEQDYRLLNLDTEAFAFEDSICEDEEDKKKAGSVSKAVLQKMTNATKTSSRQETSEVTTNILREALQQLPLLSALIAELSQLTVHPSPAQITRPAPDNHGNLPQTQSLYNTTHLPDTHLNPLPPPRSCSTPMVNHVQVKDNQKGTLNSRKSQRKKLTYGTTKTFNLRLKQISPLKVNNRECMELMKSGTQSRTVKEKEKSNPKTIKSKKRGFLLNRSSKLDENIETVMESLTVDSALRETVTLKPETQQGARDSCAQGVSEDFHPLKELKCIPNPIPSAHGDITALSKDKYTHHRELDQSDSHSDGDKFRVSVPDLTEGQSSMSNSPESLFSECSDTENDANYADDFDSLESSKASSTKPDRSPEPSRAKTPKSPVSPDSCISNSRAEGFQKRPDHHPVPVKALRSPHRVLMGTHTIQPCTLSSALSFSSDADSYDMDKPSSSQTGCSRNPVNASDKMEQSSSAESVLLPRSEKKNSPGNRNHVRGFSAQSTPSFEAQEVEELEDELGSLDFRKEYQHISELVASKLPGYTM